MAKLGDHDGALAEYRDVLAAGCECSAPTTRPRKQPPHGLTISHNERMVDWLLSQLAAQRCVKRTPELLDGTGTICREEVG
jgi:hypothetical protein